MRKFKRGDIIKMDLEKILELILYKPIWYTDKSYTIIKFRKKKTSGNILAHLDVKLPTGEETVWIKFVKLDIIAMRKKKLERLNNV